MELYDRQAGELVIQTSPQLERAGVRHGFTTRMGGVSQGIYASLNLGTHRGDDPEKVRENYRRVCGALEVDITKLVFAKQVHRDGVRTVTAEDAGKGLDAPVDYEADGLITDVPGVTLVAFGADCLTMLLCDPVHRVVGAVHAGWRGTALGIAERAVEGMGKHYGTDPADLLVALGPCIGKCCFQTDRDVPDAMTAALGGEAAPYFADGGNGRYYVDLKGLNILRLKRAGVTTEHIDISSDCTLCKPNKYWSHRHTHGERGSQAALICLP